MFLRFQQSINELLSNHLKKDHQNRWFKVENLLKALLRLATQSFDLTKVSCLKKFTTMIQVQAVTSIQQLLTPQDQLNDSLLLTQSQKIFASKKTTKNLMFQVLATTILRWLKRKFQEFSLGLSNRSIWNLMRRILWILSTRSLWIYTLKAVNHLLGIMMCMDLNSGSRLKTPINMFLIRKLTNEIFQQEMLI